MKSDVQTMATLLSLLSTEFAEGAAVAPEQRLVPDLVDSLGVFVLADLVQQRFGVELEDADLSAGTLATPETLWAAIAAKRQRGTGGCAA
jgi:acyl carrier protein